MNSRNDERNRVPSQSDGVHTFSLDRCELGVATAATQIEGGHAATNWHRWAEQPGRIKDGSGPWRANEHWNRVAPDQTLLRELNVQHYRMGIEWARVEPRPGEFDDAAIEHYRNELGGLVDAGIKPLVTLHHFNNPVWFEDDGGFLRRESTGVFQRYVQRMVGALDDLCDEWITINEPNIYATHAYYFGLWPPGERSLQTLTHVYTNLAAAHIDAYRLIHELQPGARVGVAQHLRVFRPRIAWHPGHWASAQMMEWLFQRVITRAMCKGRFLAPLRQPPGVHPGVYYDFHGINYYSRSTVSRLADGVGADVAINDLGWEIYPKGLIEVGRWLHETHPGPLYVTENGTANSDDGFRSRFIHEQLAEIASSDLPIERYYHWSFIDNWEWLEGESARFGLIRLDYETQERTMRESGRFFSEIAANRGVTEEMYQRYVAHQIYSRNATVR